MKELSVRDKKHVVHDVENYTLIQIVGRGGKRDHVELRFFLNTMHKIYTFLHKITQLSDLRVTITNVWVYIIEKNFTHLFILLKNIKPSLNHLLY